MRKQTARLVTMPVDPATDVALARLGFVLTDWQLVAGSSCSGQPQVRLEVEFHKDKIMILEHREDAAAPQRGVWIELADDHLKVRSYDTVKDAPRTISIPPAGAGVLIDEGRDDG